MNKFKRFLRLALLGLGAGIILLTATVWFLVRMPQLNQSQTLRILDRNGRELYQYLGQEKVRSTIVALQDISPWLIRATLFKEDRHFYTHFGVNPLALVRALTANIKRGRVVQGGSTVTMQLAKILRQRRSRNFWEKVKEAFLTCKLEMKLSKKEILTLYLNRIYYGNQLFGCQSAALAYFNRPVNDLSLAQAAFLATITSSPSYFNPYTRFQLVKENAWNLLHQMHKRKWITREEYEIAIHENVVVRKDNHPLQAPHFTLSLLEKEEKHIYGLSEMRTTLDLELQHETEEILKGFIAALRPRGVTQGAVLVLDNRSDEVLVWVGSTDFWNEADFGMIDGCTIKRQPGSALKPFLYSCALQRGLHAASIIPDLPTTFRDEEKLYVPRNYTDKFSGPQRLRVALASSLNIPAVYTLSRVGKGKFYDFLHKAGFESLDRGDRYYGLGLSLGSGEVTLLELARAYSSLARGGVFMPEKRVINCQSGRNRPVQPESAEPVRIADPRIAFIISSILADNHARGIGFSEETPLEFPYQVAVKTGTSEGFRDNFCIGYTRDYTVAVWVGNFPGRSMHHVSGVTGAGPVFHAVMNMVYRHKYGGIPYGYRSLDGMPEGVVKREVCPLSGMLANSDCPGRIEEFFLSESAPDQACTWHRMIEVDNRNLLLATPETPAPFRENKPFLLAPAEFQQWVIESGYHLPPLRYSELREHEFLISYPVDRSIFQHLTDLPSRYQSIRFKLKTTLRGHRVIWRVDDRLIASVRFPYSATWPITLGMHQISAESEDRKWQSRIQIVVQ